MGTAKNDAWVRWVRGNLVEHGVAQVLVKWRYGVLSCAGVVHDTVNSAVIAEDGEIWIGRADGQAVLVVVGDCTTTLIVRWTTDGCPGITAIGRFLNVDLTEIENVRSGAADCATPCFKVVVVPTL